MNRYLFFYGVLIAELAPPPVRALLAGLGPGVSATARGLLYAIDEPAGVHPAMVAGEGTVRGMLHEAGGVDLAALDRFEGADYRREPVAVATEEGQEQSADAYVWLRSTAALEVIPDGDFARWLRESGKPAFGA